MREEKNNRKYAGQVVDIPRSNYRLSVIDRLKKMTDEEGDPFLNIFSNRSIYLISLFSYEKKQSLVANLPLKDMPLLKKRTDCAEEVIFRAVNFQEEACFQVAGDRAANSVPAAFTPLKMGKLAGKTPGDLLLEAQRSGKAAEMVETLEQQADFLRGRLKKYSRNQEQIDAIEEALGYFDLGCLEEYKPKAGKGQIASLMDAQTGSKPLVIYDPPTKHQKIQNEAGKNACYSVSITCSPAKNYPYRLEIMNCYAPLGHGRNGMLPILMDQAEDIRRESIDLTEGEWLYIMDCLDENRKEAKAMWYAELRNQDEKNRWNGNGG